MIKKQVFGILVIVLAIAFNAFKGKKMHKSFISTTFYYKDGAAYQRADYSIAVNPPVLTCEKSIDQDNGASFKDIYNWNQTGNAANAYSSGVAYVNTVYIAFLDNNTDGDDSDGISLFEALNAIYAHFISNHTYPSCLDVDTDDNNTNDVQVCTTIASSCH